MNTTSTVTDPRARFWGNAAKWALLIPVGFIIAPYIWIALGGLVGLLVAVVVLAGAWMIRPWVFMKAANLRLALIKAEARRNPVLVLEEDLRRQMVALDQRKVAVNQLKAQTLNLTDKLAEIKAKWGTGGQDYIKLLGVRDNLVRLHTHRLQQWDKAHEQLGLWAREIERANDIWEAAQAAAAAQESSGLSEDDFFAKLKTDTALDSIQTSFNTALASLDTELAASDNPSISGRA